MSRVAEILGAIARHEAERRSFCELGVVTAVFDDAAGADSHTASVRLKDSGLPLDHLPVASWAAGIGCLPRVGDVVVVLFPRGALVSGIIVAQVYSDERRPPGFHKDEFAMLWPEGDAARVALRLDGGEEPAARLEVGGEDEVALSLRKGELRLSASGVAVVLRYGGSGDGEVRLEAGGTRIALKQDGEVTLTAAGKLTLKAPEIELNADGPVKINGATVDLN